jgi:hypothetical protein
MLRWHSSHNVLKNLLHDFDELGIELGHGAKLSIWPSTTIGTAILKRTFSRSSAAVESIIRDCAQALNGQENVSITRCIAGCLRFLTLTQCMVRPRVARGFVNLADAVLHQCIRPLIGACAPGHHGYQRAFELISGQASNGPFGSPEFACAGRPILHRRLILSQTSAGKGCWLRHR